MRTSIIRWAAIAFCLILAVCLLGCTSSEPAGVPSADPGETPAGSAAPSPTEEPPFPHDFDRTGIDLSGFTELLEPAKEITNEEYSAPAAPNEIKLWRHELDQGYRSPNYSFSLAELPEYDESRESEYRLNG